MFVPCYVRWKWMCPTVAKLFWYSSHQKTLSWARKLGHLQEQGSNSFSWRARKKKPKRAALFIPGWKSKDLSKMTKMCWLNRVGVKSGKKEKKKERFQQNGAGPEHILANNREEKLRRQVQRRDEWDPVRAGKQSRADGRMETRRAQRHTNSLGVLEVDAASTTANGPIFGNWLMSRAGSDKDKTWQRRSLFHFILYKSGSNYRCKHAGVSASTRPWRPPSKSSVIYGWKRSSHVFPIASKW